VSSSEEHSLDALRLPRDQAGSKPQHLIVTLFGDYWLGNTAPLPSSAVIALVAEFDISLTSARAALKRLAQRGILTPTRVGRRTFYAANPWAQAIMGKGRDRIVSFGADTTADWDRMWTVVVFSIPEQQREVRHSARSRMRWLGLAPLYDGVWVSPRDVSAQVTEELTQVGVPQATVLRARTEHPGPGAVGHPLTAWNLDELAQTYRNFLDEFEPLCRRVRAGRVGAAEALVARTAVMDTWRRFPGLDPELPRELMPDNWPRAAAHRLFVQVYDALGPLAELRFRQILGEHAPELLDHVRHHKTTDHADVPVPTG
jgi:phenylacetic acid degradation operon negative regulatory protein